MQRLLEDRRVLAGVLILGILIGLLGLWNFENSTTVFDTERDGKIEVGDNLTYSFETDKNIGDTASLHIDLKSGDANPLDVSLNGMSIHPGKISPDLLGRSNKLVIQHTGFADPPVTINRISVKTVNKSDLLVLSLFLLISAAMVLFSTVKLNRDLGFVRDLEERKAPVLVILFMAVVTYFDPFVGIGGLMLLITAYSGYTAYKSGLKASEILKNILYAFLFPVSGGILPIVISLTLDLGSEITTLTFYLLPVLGFAAPPAILLYRYRQEKISGKDAAYLLGTVIPIEVLMLVVVKKMMVLGGLIMLLQGAI